jgi:hypothetical protein
MKLETRTGLVAFTAATCALAAVVYACVPADTRPVPASLFMTVSPSPAVANGIVTADGWSLGFDRVLVGIGRTSISSSCARYSEASYDRLLEVSKNGSQKLAVLYGLGHCDLRFRVGTPSAEALLGPGTTQDDLVRMRTRGQDRWVNRGGIVLEVVGSATRAGVQKRFDFVFRSSIRYSGCTLSPDAGQISQLGVDAGEEEIDASLVEVDSGADAEPPPPEGFGVVLESEGALTRDFRIEAEGLFRAEAAAGATLRFDPYAEADTNGDGFVTLDELVKVPISRIRDGGPFEAGTFSGTTGDAGGPGGGGRPIVVESLADFVYVVLLPRLLRYGEEGSCASGVSLDLGSDGGGGRRGGGF